MPSGEIVSRRLPWKAALLALPVVGLGQLYSGRPFRSLIFHLVSELVAPLCLGAMLLRFKPWNIVLPAAIGLLWWIFVLLDAVRCSRNAPSDYRLKAYNRWYVYFLIFVVLAIWQNIAGSYLRQRILAAYKIPVESMAPTLMVGDHLMVDKFTFAAKGWPLDHLLPRRDPRRGDLIAFRLGLDDATPNHSENLIKRVIGLPGDRIRIVRRQVYVNDQSLAEPYAYYDPAFANDLVPGDDFPPEDPAELVSATSRWTSEIGSSVKDGELVVPPEKYFVLGDNRERSWDSRFWGFVSQADIIGKADVIYFSWDAQSHRIRWERIGEILE